MGCTRQQKLAENRQNVLSASASVFVAVGLLNVQLLLYS